MADKPARNYSDEPQELACEDIHSRRSGRLTLHDDDMRLNIFSFDAEDQQSLASELKGGKGEEERSEYTLRLTNGKYATLFGCFNAGESRSWGSNFVGSTFEIVPHIIVLGPRAFVQSDQVCEIRFTFVHAEEALFYREHIRSNFSVDTNRGAVDVDEFIYDRLGIANIETEKFCVHLRMSVVRGGGRIDPQFRSTPTIAVEFKTRVSLDEALRTMHVVLSFFEYSLGQKSRPINVSVSQLSEAEKAQQIESNILPEEFEIRQFYGDWTPSSNEPHRCNKLFRFYNSVERGTSEVAIKTWIERLELWLPSYSLASQYLGGSKVFNRDRLLRLMAWFEEIPIHQIGTAATRSMIEKLADATHKVAVDGDIPVSSERIKQVLNELKRVPLKQRLTLAIEKNRERFGDLLVPPSTEADCRIAAKFRDDAAHGHLKLHDDNFHEFSQAIYAVELVCCLSTAAGLPLGAENAKRAIGHPLLAYARETLGNKLD